MPSKPNLLSEVTFGSFLQYSPRGTSETSKKSRLWCDAVKFDRPGKVRAVIEHLATHASTELLGPNSTIATFALVRTMGLVPDVDSIVNPCVGRIMLTAAGKAWREP